MNISTKADRIELFQFNSPHMRAFHITWMTFFLCFFGWFGIAPLMAVVRDELHLTKAQIGNIIVASVSATIFARLFVGWLCDKIGPRLTYSWLLWIGAFPVMGIGLAHDYTSFLIFRLAIGIIGASFVITQYHTSVMFSGSVVGTANATVAGWGNLGGGVTQMVMPLLFAGIVALGFSKGEAWRYAMIVPGAALFVMGFVYFFFTQDAIEGSLKDIRYRELYHSNIFSLPAAEEKVSYASVLKDYRLWILFLIYGASFGMEITIDNIAALYFIDHFHLGMKEAGIIAGLFGMMNLFARALGGFISDRVNRPFGLQGRALVLSLFLAGEAVGLIFFSQSATLWTAVALMITFAFFLKMANGGTYAVVPFVNKRAVGLVSGIVGAGGNVGAMCFGLMFKGSLPWPRVLFILGIVIACIAALSLLIRFRKEEGKKPLEIIPVPIHPKPSLGM